MSDVVYLKQCVVCAQQFEVEQATDWIGEHIRTDLGLVCNGSSHPGQMITQKLKGQDSPPRA